MTPTEPALDADDPRRWPRGFRYAMPPALAEKYDVWISAEVGAVLLPRGMVARALNVLTKSLEINDHE